MKSSKGFVLFEVLVSATILSVACLFLSRSLNAAIRSARVSQDYYLASLVLENLLWELDHSNLNASGSIDKHGSLQNLNWDIAQNVTARGNLNQQTINLSWNMGSNKKEYLEMSSYVAAQ